MRDSFRDGGPALIPKTDPRSCTLGPHEENEPAAAHGLQHDLKLEMELTLAPLPPPPGPASVWPHGPLPWGEKAWGLLYCSNRCPHGVNPGG